MTSVASSAASAKAFDDHSNQRESSVKMSRSTLLSTRTVLTAPHASKPLSVLYLDGRWRDRASGQRLSVRAATGSALFGYVRCRRRAQTPPPFRAAGRAPHAVYGEL